tara:strand:+ start:390 stop:1139 length:750 start_codon:yes stop_codon:yes gene_type:complete
MSIHVHKTGLNKTLGQQSDGIVTANLTGNFDPSSNVETSYWQNQVAEGRSLRRFNSITHNNSAPHNFQFDGTDDYLGAASSGYGGLPFNVNAANAFTLAQWVKYNAANHQAFILSNDSDEMTTLDLNANTSNKAYLTVMSSTTSVSDGLTFDFTFSDDTWYYIALTHDGSGNYVFYVNGSFIGTSDMGKSAFNGALRIGRSGSNYTASGTKVGHVHVYSAVLTNSQIRQNFLATHEINSDRIYGATYQA